MTVQTINLNVLADTSQAEKGAAKLKQSFHDAVNPKLKGAYSKAASSGGGGDSTPTGGQTKTARSVGEGAGTGSAASDFAAQAQGLGGLVHVYATFAANIYAVSAAFNALSKAMDVTNLVKGLDQIGAATGKNLGSLAKQMVAVADGAISMQQAMSSTAMASAGGMTNQAILRMTEVAKKASLALGRDMTDSMDRITKGIIKTQPELLDELGIMTRVIPAQQEYARQIGKTAASLTDFEKRQAFANAVLAEGERKFGAIAMEANPYSKISASINNLVQSGLELINKVLGPLVSLLSTSPTGLTLTLGAFASVLLKQAIPAIGMFRENAKRMEAETHARVARQVKDQQDAAVQFDTIAAMKAEKAFQAEASTTKRLEAMQTARFNRKMVGDDVRTNLRRSPFDLTDSDIKNIHSKQEELAKSTDTAALKQAEKLKNHLANIQKIRQESVVVGDKAAELAESRDTKWYSHQSQMAKNLADLNKKAAQNKVLSNAADNAAVMGPSLAFRALREETSKLDMGRVAKGVTLVKGSFSILTSAIGTAVNAFGIWGQLIGLVIAGFAVLDGWMSKSSKQSEAFSGSIDTLKSSFDNVDRTLDVIGKKDLKDFISVESIQARANAFNDLTENLSTTVDKFSKLQEAQNGWDKFFDGFWDMFGKGSGDKLAAGVSNSVIDALKLMSEGPAKEKAKKDIASLFDIPDNVGFESVDKFNSSLKDLDKTVIGSKAKNIEKILADASRSANNAASSLTAFKTALGDVNKQATTISNTLMPVDDISKMGMALNTAASSMALSLEDPITGLTALRELAGDIKSLSFLPPGLAVELGTSKRLMDDLSASLADAEKQQTAAQAKVNQAKGELEALGGKLNDNNFQVQKNYSKRYDATEVLRVEEEKLKLVNDRISKEKEGVEAVVNKYKGITKELAKELATAGFEKMAQGLNKALAEAGVAAAKGYLDVIKQAGGFTEEMDANLTKQQISIQIEDIKARYQGTIALNNLTLEVQRNTLAQDKSTLSRELFNATERGLPTKDILAKIDNLDKGIREIDLAKAIAGSGSKAVRAYAKAASSEGGTSELRGAMGMLTDVVAQSFGKDSQLAKLFGDMQNAQLRAEAGKVTDDTNKAKQPLANEAKRLSNSATELSNLQALNGMYNEQLQKSKEINAEAQLKNKFQVEELDLNAKKKINEIALKSKDPKAVAEAERNAVAIEASLATSRAEKETQLGVLASKNLQERKLGVAQLAKLEEERAKANRQYILDIKAAEDTTAESKLTYLKEVGGITEAEYTKQSATIKAAAEERKFNEEILNLKKAQSTEQQTIKDRIEAANASIKNKNDTTAVGPVDTSKELAIIEQQTKLLKDTETTNNNIVTAKTLQNEASKEALALQTSHNVLMQQQADLMTQMQSLTDSLTTAFGDIGTSIGGAAKSMVKFAQTEEKHLKAKSALEDKLNDPNADAKDRKLAATAIAKLEKKHEAERLDGISEIAGATKKMFDEKSAAHKAFAAVEKVTAAMSIALKVQAMAADLLALGPAMMLAKTQLFAQGGWAGFAGVAAFMALVGAGGGGGGGMSLPPGVTSAERQETQGTGGVFGDTSAKSESITNSLELLTSTSVEGMSYSSEMVKLLTSINSGIENLAVSLYAVQGVGSGTGFGTVEATSGGSPGLLGGLFGSSSTDTSIIDSGIILRGTFTELANAGNSASAVLKQFETVQTTATRTGALFGLFGGGSSTAITENTKGLDQAVRTQIGEIFTNATNLFISQGERLGQTEASVLSMLDTVNVDKLASLRGLKGAELQKELNSVISSIMDDTAKALFPALGIFKKFGEGYAQTVTRVLNNSEKVGQAFRQMGVTLGLLPEAARTASAELINNVRDSEAALTRAKQALEASRITTTTPGAVDGAVGITTTSYDPQLMELVATSETRLADARKAVEEANRGLTTNNLALTEKLVEAAGGLDEFISLTESFTDKYLTDVEKVAPRLGAMHTEMERLGVSTSITRSGLKDLIRNYQVTDEASAEYYVDLLKIADAYAANSEIIDKVTDSLGLSSSSISSILTNAVNNAKSAEEARALGTQGAADAIGAAMQEALISGVTGIINEAMTSIVSNLISGSAASALNMVSGGAVAGTNMASGATVAASNVAAGGTIAASNVAAGGADAGSSLSQGGANAANAMVSGAENVRTVVAGAIVRVREFVSTFVAVMADPEVQASLKELTAGFGEFAAATYTGSSAISGMTTAIGGSSKAAKDAASSASSAGSAAADAGNKLVDAWQAVADSIFDEVARIKGLLLGTGPAALENAQSSFNAATAAARAGDIEQAKLLPKLSQTLLALAETNAASAMDLRRVQAATAASLETTGLGAVATYGLKLPSYDVGTNYVPQDMIAQIHEGERIVPKAFNQANMMDTKDMVAELRELRRQVADLVNFNRDIQDNTKKTRDVIVRVTEDGRAMQSETI